ncbi:hypothetical protein [Tautonia rosea]|uniref:hypothetical protein n=1 Tax=Tautonia rosea TaxID=2728037 RepID=UPI0014729F5C|nr:hypothetical protein [Tautonia rosea]
MQHTYDHQPDPVDLIRRIDELEAGCDPDFDAGLEELEREFAELRLRFGDGA